MISISSAVFTSLSELLKKHSKSKTIKLLKTFFCPANKDVEDFLHRNAIKFELSGLSRTYIWYLEEPTQVVAYFTIALKAISLDEKILESIKQEVSIENLEEVLGDLLKGFPLKEQNKQIPVYLIGQVGKIPQVEKLNGYLVKVALRKIEEASEIVGGKIVVLDVDTTPLHESKNKKGERSLKSLLNLYKELKFKELYKYPGNKEKTYLRLYRKLD